MMESDSDSDSPEVSHPYPFVINPEHHFSTPLPPNMNVYPGGAHSLSGIAMRAACLGLTAGVSLVLAFTVGYIQLPFFLFLLSLFHLLEFWTTARYNTPNAKTSSFLLSINGTAYNIAHTAAITEALIELYFFPSFKRRISPFPTVLGFVLIVIGQTIRTLAMVHAGTNFNHLVQRQKRPGHELVKHGVYSWCRHPSYFGFFWWGLGTQLMLANPACFVGYAVVLWKFFRDRIEVEERHLVGFFGKEYITYRQATRVGIPFIR